MEGHSNQRETRDKQPRSSTGLKGLVRWATTPPQAIAVYLICFGLVAGLSFYVGTLKPKKPIGVGPPPAATAPRN
jgi:hypothetical protein